MLIGVVPDLALRRRTCYEPLVSTHPDTQGVADSSTVTLTPSGAGRASVEVRARDDEGRDLLAEHDLRVTE